MDMLMQVFVWLAVLLVFLVGAGLFAALVLYISDRSQTEDAVRRNYPLIGRFRGWFSVLGEFFRQYFFAMDREEMPFNRAQRDWVSHSAEGKGVTVAFGSTRNLSEIGTPIFVNAAFPPLDDQCAKTQPLIIGPGARVPYAAKSIYNISGMSYGALSKPAVRALSRGARKAGIWMNTGEGALSPHHIEGGCDIIFQIGTAKYGVRTEDGGLDDDKLRRIAERPEVKMIEIKLAQGAKPGKGGILPGEKVTEEIAEIRGIPAGQPSLSPNRHREAGSWPELLDFIAHVREVSGLPTGIKTVMGAAHGLEPLFDEIRARGPEAAPDFITLDGGEGGTGAAPMPLIDLVGMSVREALPRLVDLRDAAGLHDRIRIVASGKLVNPADVAWAIAAGADFVTSARGFMFSLGCIQALKCNRNTCPTGITTHNPRLQEGLVVEDKEERVARYARAMIHDIETIAHSVGVTEPRQMRRHHVRVVGADGRSLLLSDLMPEVSPGARPANPKWAARGT